MSRGSIILIAIIVLIVGGAVSLARVNTEVAPVRVEKPVAAANAAPAQ